MSKENFNIDKAYELRLIYKKKRQHSKENLISQIIMRYNICPQLSIESTISVIGYFQYKTVESVCDDLGYNLGYMNHSPIRGLYGKEYGSFTNIMMLSHIEYLEGED